METISAKKEAQILTKNYKDRFAEFVKGKGLNEVAKKSGCNYQALRNSVVDIYNPSPDTVFQVKLGYGDEFDEVYIFTGKRVLDSVYSNSKLDENISNNQLEILQERLESLEEKLKEKEKYIEELRMDKAFLQEMIKKQ